VTLPKGLLGIIQVRSDFNLVLAQKGEIAELPGQNNPERYILSSRDSRTLVIVLSQETNIRQLFLRIRDKRYSQDWVPGM
jgi:hypothetical protein